MSICPVSAINIEDGIPKLTGKCTACGACYQACPRSEHNNSDLEKNAMCRSRNAEELIGVVKGAYAVKSTSSEILTHAQDGGAVTSILLNQLNSGVGGAVVAGLGKEKTWQPIPMLAETQQHIIECAGTKYTSASMLLGLVEAEKKGMKRVVFVGTPCQVHAVRRREQIDQKEKLDVLTIGLFCMETFDYYQLLQYLKEQEVDPEKVTKFEIKSGKFIAKKGTEPPFEVKIKRIKDLSRLCCRTCQDYTSELADLSIGNVGSPNGWSTVLVRTDKGEKALRSAEKAGLIEIKPLTDFEPGINLVNKLSEMKKKENSGESYK
jgi:coenzyme F420 hydrogenase subunit beta